MKHGPTSLAGAIMDFFGRKPNQSAIEFMNEVKALTDEDRAYFKVELTKVGYEIK